MKKFVLLLLVAVAGFAAFVGSPLFQGNNSGESADAWQVLRYTMGVESLDGSSLFAADTDGDGLITLFDAVRLALGDS